MRMRSMSDFSQLELVFLSSVQRFETVLCVTGRASGLEKTTPIILIIQLSLPVELVQAGVTPQEKVS